MIGISGWLTQMLTGLLEPAERDAVRGDLTESGLTVTRALGEVLGLVARRQAALWYDWRPWVALFGIALPLGVVLSGFVRYVGGPTATYFWLYWDNSRLTDFGDAGFRYGLAKDLAWTLLNYATLAAWSWLGGFTLGSLSRRAAWLTAALFVLTLWLSPLALAETNTYQSGRIFFFSIYRLGWILILETLVISIPALWGARRGVRRGTLSPFRTALWAGAATLLTARWFWGPGTHRLVWLLTLVAVSWPVIYLMADPTTRPRGSRRGGTA